MKKMQTLLAAVFLSLFIGLIAPAHTTYAHRDGCHRWHSCPSDSGSYVCGDLGYYSECPTAPQPVHVPVTTTQIVDTNEGIAFGTATKNTWKEYTGYAQQIVAGVNGTKKISTKVTYVDGTQTNSEVVSAEVVTQPQDAAQLVGKRIKPLAMITKITKQKHGKYTARGQYIAGQQVVLSLDGKKLKKVSTDSKGEFVVKNVNLKSTSSLKIYKVTGKKDQQISEKTFVDLKKNTLITEYAKLHQNN
jgi:hypothetical protein